MQPKGRRSLVLYVALRRSVNQCYLHFHLLTRLCEEKIFFYCHHPGLPCVRDQQIPILDSCKIIILQLDAYHRGAPTS